MDEYKECHLARVPSHAIVARSVNGKEDAIWELLDQAQVSAPMVSPPAWIRWWEVPSSPSFPPLSKSFCSLTAQEFMNSVDCLPRPYSGQQKLQHLQHYPLTVSHGLEQKRGGQCNILRT